MPSIVFQVKDAQGRDLTNVKASIDGAPVGSLAGTALQVDVGDHEFVFSADGYNAVTQHFVIVEAQKDRREIVTLTSNAPVVVEPPPPPPVVAQPQPPTPQLVVNPVTYAPPLVANPAAAEARSSRRTTAIILCVFGAVSLGGSVAFGVLGGQENSSIKNGGFSTASDIASADTAGTAFNVMLGVTLASGLVLAAIGVPLLLLNLGGGTPTRSVGLHVTPGGLRLQW
jgi:hypothetical protein